MQKRNSFNNQIPSNEINKSSRQKQSFSAKIEKFIEIHAIEETNSSITMKDIIQYVKITNHTDDFY